MSASAGTMRATTPRAAPALPLWSTSACAALLVHVIFAALLFVSWSRRLTLPTGSPGTLNSLDVEVAPAAAPAVSPATTVSSDSVRPTPSPLQFKAVPEVAELTSDPQPAPAPAPTVAQTSLPTTADSLTSIAPLGESTDSAGSPSAWLAQVESQLARQKQYPPSALRRRQQDSVQLQFSVDPAGRVTASHVDSARHYKALEQEVQHMLQLAAPFPAPPSDLSVDTIVIHTEVDFSIIAPKPAPSAHLCPRPAAPGPVPAGDSTTLEQMHAYQDHLQQYVTATRSYLDCMSLAHATPAGNALIAQLNTLVAGFNTQAQEFKKAAQARALQAQQQAAQAAATRLAQARGMAQQAYAACTIPSASSRPPPITTLTPATLPAYRKRLVAYDAAVTAYAACIDKARQGVLAQVGDGLSAAQRIELDVDAAKAGNAVINPLDQLVAAFNTQLHKMQKESIAAEQNLADVFARDSALFPNSSWSVPAPLPTDECLRIGRLGQGYQAQLCRSSYTTKVPDGPAADAPGMDRAVRSGAIVVTQAPSALGNDSGGNGYQTISYSLVGFNVAGTHVSFTIQGNSDAVSARARNSVLIHFDLVLSADKQSLSGRCSAGLQRWNCQLSRRP